MTDQPHCRGTKRNGEPCRSTLALSADGYCLQHDPKRVEQRREARAAGGRSLSAKHARAKLARLSDQVGGAATSDPAPEPIDYPPKATTLEQASINLAWISDAALRGVIDPRVAREASFALNGFKSVAEKRDLQREVAQYRKELAELRQRTVADTTGPRRGPAGPRLAASS